MNEVDSNHGHGIVLKEVDSTLAGSTKAFLKSELRFTKDKNGQEICMAQIGNGSDAGEEVGVMMGWETPISESQRELSTPDALRKGLTVT